MLGCCATDKKDKDALVGSWVFFFETQWCMNVAKGATFDTVLMCNFILCHVAQYFSKSTVSSRVCMCVCVCVCVCARARARVYVIRFQNLH